MAVLHVRDIPDVLYRQVQKMAQARGRSLSAEVIDLLEEAARQEAARRRHARLMAQMRRDIWSPPSGAPDSEDLVRAARSDREAETADRGA